MTHQDDDASYRLLFSTPELVRDLILGFIPDEWLHSLDYATLEKVPDDYVADSLQRRADDVVWRIRAAGEWVYLYILIEFQSTVDAWMAVRVMTYVGLLYQDLIRRSEVLPNQRLPPVLPIVLYNGDARWTAATDIAALIPKAPGLAGRYLPKLEYLLIDQSQYTDSQLAPLKNLVAAVLRFERPDSMEALLQLIDSLNDWLDGQPELKRTFAIWIRAVLLRRGKFTQAIPKVRDLKELKMSLAARFDLWAQQYEQKGELKGKQEGKQEGKSELLQRLLVRRFGPLPHDIVQQLASATTPQIELWGDRMLDARSLAEVFADE